MPEPTLTPEQEKRVGELCTDELRLVNGWKYDCERAIAGLEQAKGILEVARQRAIEQVLKEGEAEP